MIHFESEDKLDLRYSQIVWDNKHLEQQVQQPMNRMSCESHHLYDREEVHQVQQWSPLQLWGRMFRHHEYNQQLLKKFQMKEEIDRKESNNYLSYGLCLFQHHE